MNLFQEAKSILDKSGKVNPLGPYGKSKLTGREISTYFRRNKVKDAEIRKAVEVALDLGGADTIARKAIKDFYGDKILKSKEVQKALQYANEEVVKEDLNTLSENYRALAQKGMGTESEKDARVGLELDFYDSKGNKHFGKIVKKDRKGYTVKDNKGKMHSFSFLDRQKAKKLLVKTDKLSNIIKKNTIKKGKFAGYMTDDVSEDAEAKAKLQLKHARETEKLKAKQEMEKERMSESVMNTYRQMWEDGQKYAPRQELGEQDLQEKVANITVDPKNTKYDSVKDQNAAAQEVAQLAKRSGLKVAYLGKNIRVVGNQKKVNDFLRVVIGRARYGDPTEKDMTTPQIDKLLSKDLGKYKDRKGGPLRKVR